jgi:hypothetical protein
MESPVAPASPAALRVRFAQNDRALGGGFKRLRYFFANVTVFLVGDSAVLFV